MARFGGPESKQVIRDHVQQAGFQWMEIFGSCRQLDFLTEEWKRYGTSE